MNTVKSSSKSTVFLHFFCFFVDNRRFALLCFRLGVRFPPRLFLYLTISLLLDVNWERTHRNLCHDFRHTLILSLPPFSLFVCRRFNTLLRSSVTLPVYLFKKNRGRWVCIVSNSDVCRNGRSQRPVEQGRHLTSVHRGCSSVNKSFAHACRVRANLNFFPTLVAGISNLISSLTTGPEVNGGPPNSSLAILQQSQPYTRFIKVMIGHPRLALRTNIICTTTIGCIIFLDI